MTQRGLFFFFNAGGLQALFRIVLNPHATDRQKKEREKKKKPAKNKKLIEWVVRKNG